MEKKKKRKVQVYLYLISCHLVLLKDGYTISKPYENSVEFYFEHSALFLRAKRTKYYNNKNTALNILVKSNALKYLFIEYSKCKSCIVRQTNMLLAARKKTNTITI